MAEFDVVIRGATVFDGSGADGVVQDVGVRGERIAAVGELGAASAGEVIAGAGLALAPGFIDVHAHDDWAVLLDPEFPCKVMQGVTTDIVGNCGIGVAPFSSASRVLSYDPDRAITPWEGFAGYLERVDEVRPSLNIAVLMGHGTIRLGSLGNAQRPPTEAELDEMRAWVREGRDAGAVGLSTGLIYEPGRYAATEEIIALARELGPDGGLYTTHMRNEGRFLLDSVREAIRIGEEAGVPVQISHHKVGGRDNWGLVNQSLLLIEEARARGVDVMADQYPYTAGSTQLAAILLNNAFNEKGVDGGLGRAEPGNVLIASCPAHPEYEGKTVQELADLFDLPGEEAAQRVVREDSTTFAVIETMAEADVRTVLRHPTTMIGSDGIALGSKPHPRLYGTFPRVLGRYVREEGVLDLATAIHRMTGMPAKRFKLEGRGSIAPGAFADLVLFDPATIADTGTYSDPARSPVGISGVWVNGARVARDGEHTHARPGRALRRG
jgi:N-acyl-D-amino-acid deacylase